METLLEYQAETAAALPRRYTYADYKALDVDDNFFYELINGELVKKSAPKPRHQIISARLFRLLSNYVIEKDLGIALYAPVDVYVNEYSVPQPDLLFIRKSNEGIITDDGVMGAPDLVVEIISPSSIQRDRRDKFKLYKQHGISEYWIIDPRNSSVEIYCLSQDSSGANVYDLAGVKVAGETFESTVITGFTVLIDALFM